MEANTAMIRCPKMHNGQRCGTLIPNQYGAIGVSLSRRDNRTLICSECGKLEAFADYTPAVKP